jgi:hypothetical protein
MELPQVTHDAPIAGQSLTAEVGNRPWQNPPQFVEVDDAINFYVPKLLDPAFSNQLLDVIEMGVPLTTIANSLQISGVMQGLHTIDVGILVLPVLVEMMTLMAEDEGIDYKSGMDDRASDLPSDSTISLAMKKAREKMGKEEPQQPMQEEPMEEPQGPPTTGLMGRRSM